MRLLQQGNASAAKALLEDACRKAPHDAQAWHFLGVAHQALGDPLQAERCLREAAARGSPSPFTYYNLGVVLYAKGDMRGAIECYRQALAINPNSSEARNNLGGCLLAIKQTGAAEREFRRAAEINPRSAEAHASLAAIHLLRANYREAIRCLRLSLELNAGNPKAHYNLSHALLATGEPEDSIASVRQAIALRPDYARAHVGLASALLGSGRFAEGWREYEWNWTQKAQQRPFPPSSPADALTGRSVFVHAEQGIGDELFFLRFVRELRRRGAITVVYRPTPKIHFLLSRVAAIDRLAGPEEGPEHESAVFSVGDLPVVVGMERTDQIPAPLAIPPVADEVARMRHRLADFGPPPYVAVTWRAGTPNENASLYKEVPIAEFARSLAGIDARIIVVQRHPAAEEIQRFSGALGRAVFDASAFNEDLEGMLALLSVLDDYVGVSNTNMYLTAAAGKTARVLVPNPPEWRWMVSGSRSPWFPGFSVYRQAFDGGWGKALAALRSDLDRRLQSQDRA